MGRFRGRLERKSGLICRRWYTQREVLRCVNKSATAFIPKEPCLCYRIPLNSQPGMYVCMYIVCMYVCMYVYIWTYIFIIWTSYIFFITIRFHSLCVRIDIHLRKALQFSLSFHDTVDSTHRYAKLAAADRWLEFSAAFRTSNFSDRVKFLLLWRDMVGVSPAESIHELNTTFSVKVIYES